MIVNNPGILSPHLVYKWGPPNQTSRQQACFREQVAVCGLVLIGVASLIAAWQVRVISSPPENPGPFAGDVIAYYLPNLTYSAESLKNGELPLWNPYEFIGMPMFATLEYGPLYPLNALALWLAPGTLHVLSALLHILLFGIFSFLFFRRTLRVEIWAALIGAATGCASGWALSRALMYPDEFRSAVYIPLILLLADNLMKSPRARNAVFLAATLAMQFLGGETEICARTGLLLTAWFTMRAVPALRGKYCAAILQSAAWMLCAVFLAMSFTAVQLFPAIETAREGARALGGLSFRQAMQGGIESRAELFQHMIEGVSDSRAALYTGAPALLLSLAALAYWRRAETVFFAALALVSFELLRGEASFIARAVYYLPTGDWFRFPIRFLPFLVVSVSALASLGFQRLWQALKKSTPVEWLVTVGLLCCCVVVCALWNALRPTMESSSAAGVTVIVTLCAFLARRSPSSIMPRVVLAAILGMGVLGLPLLQFDFDQYSAPRAVNYTGVPESAITFLREHAGPQDRIYVDFAIPDYPRLPKFGTNTRLACISGFSPFVPGSFWSFIRPYLSRRVYDPAASSQETGHVPIGLWGGLALSSGALDAFEILRVRFIITGLGTELFYPHMKRTLPESLPHGLRVVWREDDTTILENSHLLPRAFVVKKPPSQLDIQAILRDARQEAEVESLCPHRIIIHADAKASGTLVLTDQHYPGWRAYVDGVRTEIKPAAGLFRSVSISAGAHEVVFEYRPASFWAGALVSVCSIIGAFFIVVWEVLVSRGGTRRHAVNPAEHPRPFA